MLDKLKQLGQLKALQDSMKSEKFIVEKEGFKIVMNGNLQVEEVIVNPDLPAEQQNQIIKDCTNEAIAKTQKGMAQKLQGMNLGF